MYVQPGSLSKRPFKWPLMSQARGGGLRICRLIKTSPLPSFYLFCNPLSVGAGAECTA